MRRMQLSAPVDCMASSVHVRCRALRRRSPSRAGGGAASAAAIPPELALDRSRCRSIRRCGPGSCRTGSRYFIRQQRAAGQPRVAAPRGQRRRRSRRSTISAASRTCSSTWRSTAPSTSSRASWSSFLESIGARFGPHVNAYTSFDETVYMLDVPTDRAGLRRARLDGAAAISPAACRSCPTKIEKERGVVIEEWRGRLGAGSRLTDKQLPVILPGLALRRAAADRHAGDPQERSRAQRLRDFYQKWYRPDRMAVVVVGDIDPAEAREAGASSTSAAFRRRPAPSRRSTPGAARTRRRSINIVDRSRSAGLVGVDRVQAAGRARSDGRRLPPVARRAAGRRRC